jgi:hypothetical protein
MPENSYNNPTVPEDNNDRQDDEAAFQAYKAQLTREELRYAARLHRAWTLYCSRLQRAMNTIAEGKAPVNDEDTAEQLLQQEEAVFREELLRSMDAPPEAVAIPRRLLLAFENRRIGIVDSLFAILTRGGDRQPTIAQMKFRACAVRTAIEMRHTKQVSWLDLAYEEVVKLAGWIGTDPDLKTLLDRALTPDAVRGWYEDRNRDIRFGRYFIAFEKTLPDLSGTDLLNWLKVQISSPAGEAFKP